VAFWSFMNVMTLAIIMLICFETPRRRQEERFAAKDPVVISWQRSGEDARSEAVALDYSLTGMQASAVGLDGPRDGEVVRIVIPGVGAVDGTAVGDNPDRFRARFDWSRNAETRDRLIVKLFASGEHEAGLRSVPIREILAAAWDRFFSATWLEADRR
jgi:hypothetical protein